MKANWREIKLDDAAHVGAGNPAPQNKASFNNGKHPFFRTSDVGQIRFGELATSVDLLNDMAASSLRPVSCGTILMPKSGASTFLNHRVITGVDGYVSSHLATIKAKKDVADERYLLYALLLIRAQELLPENSYPSLKLSLIKNIRISLPPLEEQRRIVAVLDEAFEGLDRARAHAEANVHASQELFECHLASVFKEIELDAHQLCLADAATEFGRGRSRHRPRNDPNLYGGSYPFIQTGDVRNCNGFILDYSQTYNDRGLAQSKLWPEGTVCITIAANIAETGILGFESCFPDSVIGMVCDQEATFSEYVEFMLRYFAVDLKAQGKGSAQDNINLGTFERSLFPFPSLELQRQAVSRLQQLSNEIEALGEGFNSDLTDLDDLRQSLLQRAFAGELT